MSPALSPPLGMGPQLFVRASEELVQRCPWEILQLSRWSGRALGGGVWGGQGTTSTWGCLFSRPGVFCWTPSFPQLLLNPGHFLSLTEAETCARVHSPPQASLMCGTLQISQEGEVCARATGPNGTIDEARLRPWRERGVCADSAWGASLVGFLGEVQTCLQGSLWGRDHWTADRRDSEAITQMSPHGVTRWA